MNYLWESWLDVFTQTSDEAIVNRVQGKTIEDYSDLLAQAFREMHRVLKPNRWLSIVFHNSSAKVWAAIQQAITQGDFNIASIQTLDKRHGTFKQFVSENAVGYDLVIHCCKETGGRKVTGSQRIIDSLSTAKSFIEGKLENGAEGYSVHYLHVNRESEVDSRKLYSLWLKEVMESNKVVDISYDAFRRMVTEVVDSKSILDTPQAKVS